MGSGTTSLRRNMRAHITGSVRRVFYAEGVRHIGLEEILTVSGVAKATFYHHFPSKEALILEMLQQGDDHWLQWFTARVADLEPEPRSRLWAVFDALAEWHDHASFRGCLLTNLGPELARPTHYGHALYQRHMEHVRAFLEGLAREAGLDDPPGAARTLQLLIEGANAVARLERSPAPASRAQELARRLLEP